MTDDTKMPAVVKPAAYPAESNPVAVYLAELNTPAAVDTQRRCLERIAALGSSGKLSAERFPWHKLRYEHTRAIRAALVHRELLAPATVNKHLSALRRVLGACFGMDMMKAEDYYRAVHVKDVKGEAIPTGRRVTRGELTALIQCCPDSPGGDRDAALIAVLYGTAVRRSECCALDLDDYRPAESRLVVRMGKGLKKRNVPLIRSVQNHLETWVYKHHPDLDGPLFCPVHRGGRVDVRRLSPQSVGKAVRRIADRAGVEPFSPHDLRRTFASDFLDAGGDLVLLQRILGHKNANTTQRYDKREEAAALKAAELLNVPQRRPDAD